MWGAAQALAFAMGGLVGTGLSDFARFILEDTGMSYAFVFCIQALFFSTAAYLAKNLFSLASDSSSHSNKKQDVIVSFATEL
jgi:MFS transporter, BCD family, chlorophyll transporter